MLQCEKYYPNVQRLNPRYISDSSDDDTGPIRTEPKKNAAASLASAPSTPVFRPVSSPLMSDPLSKRTQSVDLTYTALTLSPIITKPHRSISACSESIAGASRTPVSPISSTVETAHVSASERRMFLILETIKANQEDIISCQKVLENKVACLSLIGGRNKEDTVRRIMAQCLTNTLALQCNWIGRNNKISFSTLHLNKVVMGAIRKNPLTQKVTASVVEEVQKSWLRFAGDRDGKRKNRQAANQ
ncbi:hypothetical protein BSL78_29950 [Apostichopus japonicus]|uniref:DUF4806 domain-containing protein n=1 Tax=Stichopus japonicus TaxID=307972 RepID=A0A2G8JBX2_STIJA|nr:hypothetical protein BSL78_29950 [Apostichopus japonicus]